MTALAVDGKPRPRGKKTDPYLPSFPLAQAIDKLARQSDLGAVCELAGVPERVVWRWRQGESGGRVDLDLADLVLTRLGLLWWDVWNEDTVREPLFVVKTYRRVRKRDKCRHLRDRRVNVRTIPYGDLGTDYWALREVERIMTGDGLEA